MSNSRPTDQLYIMRFIACLWIVIYHYHSAFPALNAPWLEPIIRQASSLPLTFFFVLSGFVLTVRYYDQTLSWREFIAHRLVHIYPLHMLSVLLWIAAVAAINYNPHYHWDIIVQFFALDAWFPQIVQQYNYPVWASGVLLFFYLLFPWLIKLKRMPLRCVIILVILLWLASLIAHLTIWQQFVTAGRQPEAFKLLYYLPLLKVDQFAIGVVTGLLYCRYRDRASLLFRWILPLLSFVTIACTVIGQQRGWHFWGRSFYDLMPSGLLAPAIASLILALALSRSNLTKLAAHPWLVFLGKISFGMYLLQAPVWIIYVNLIRHSDVSLTLIDLGVFLSLLTVGTTLIYLFFEQPVKRWLEDK